jgi:hypothetical protein
VEKQWILQSLNVYVCSLRYPACNAYAPCSYLWPSPLYNIFQHYLINGKILEKKLLCVLILSTTFVGNFFHSKKNWARYDQKFILIFMQSTLYSCPILIKLEFFRQIFGKKITQISNIMKIRPVGADRWTDRHDEANISF